MGGVAGLDKHRTSPGAIKYAIVAASLLLPTTTGAAAPHGPASADAASRKAQFGATVASRSTQIVANWVAASGNNEQQPYVVIDKVNAKAFVFDRHGVLLGAAPVLLGLAVGDRSPPGIGTRIASP